LQTNNIGLILDPNSLENLKYVSTKAEKYNFHSLWVTELYRSSFEQLSFLASMTTKIKLGSAVTLAFTRSPLVTVISAHDIDDISNGRLILGLGSGAINTNRKWHNSPNFDKPTERMESFYSLFREIENSISKREDLFYKDEFYDISIKSFRRPFTPLRGNIPLYLGGIGPNMTNLSSKKFDGYIGHVVCSINYLRNNIVPHFKNNASKAKISSIILCSINKDKKKAVQDAKGTIAFYATVKAYFKPFIDLGYESNIKKIRDAYFNNDKEEMIKNVSDEMVKDFAICGNRDDALSQLNNYNDLLSFPILTAPHYYLESGVVRQYQDEILETFKL
tara:strand:+ start:21501 stop:22502 length:1002 start_codon:yes stop_codon:yes gene_type:complete